MKQKHLLTALFALPLSLSSQSQAGLIFQDTWNTSTSSLDSRFERAAPSTRQTFGPTSNIPAGNQTAGIGVLAPTYSPTQPTDYHDQIISNGTVGYLLLAGDNNGYVSGFDGPGITTLSPFYNFDHLDTLGNSIATRVNFDLDAYSNSAGAGTPSYSHAAFTVGSLTTNGFNGRAESGTTRAGFSVRFVEDAFTNPAQPNYFLQFLVGNTLTQNLIPNPALGGPMKVQLNIYDSAGSALAPGNPWDGGSTTIEVLVNGNPVGSPEVIPAGFTDNIMTMEGSANFAGFGLAIHQFDNLQVWSIPEPSAALLGGLGFLGLLRRRRH